MHGEHSFTLSYGGYNVKADIVQRDAATMILLRHSWAQLSGLIMKIGKDGATELTGFAENKITRIDELNHHWPTGRFCLKFTLGLLERSMEIGDAPFRRALRTIPLAP